MELTNGNIASITPNVVITQSNTRTLTCVNGWHFSDSTISKSFTCIGLETYNPILEFCTGEVQNIFNIHWTNNANNLKCSKFLHYGSLRVNK